MSFEKYKKRADEKWFNYREGMTQGVAQQERDRFYQLYMAYSNHKLVMATWILVASTLILSGIGIYFQHFSK